MEASGQLPSPKSGAANNAKPPQEKCVNSTFVHNVNSTSECMYFKPTLC